MKIKIITGIFAISMLPVLLALQKSESKTNLENAKTKIEVAYTRNVIALDSMLEEYPTYFPDSSYDVRKQKYQELAYRVKAASSFLIYFEPDTYLKKVAGPFHFTAANSNEKGFFKNVPDNFLFTGPLGIETDKQLKRSSLANLSVEAAFIARAAGNYLKVYRNIGIREKFRDLDMSHLMDALRKEIFRISVIDVGNADFIIDTASVPAIRGAVNSWLTYTQILVDALPDSSARLVKKWQYLHNNCQKYLEDHNDFLSFDRMKFIKGQLIPLSVFLCDLQYALHIPFIRDLSAIHPNAKYLYAKDALDPDFFAGSRDGYYSLKRAQLGALLFFDPLLSGNNQRSCASCHKPEMGFTDGLSKGLSFDRSELPRNTPTIIASGFQQSQFWDARAKSMEDQMDTVLNSSKEMHSNFKATIQKLNHSPEYVRLFEEAYPHTRLKGIAKRDIKNAISVYERSLTGMNSRFDQYMFGKDDALTNQEINGFNVFMGKAKCGVCHYAPLFNGTVPPFYTTYDHHSDGVPLTDSVSSYKIDPDKGIAQTTGNQLDGFSFKTPTLRNITFTAPYMHNGAFKTLERVVDFYNEGAGAQFGGDFNTDLHQAGLPPIGLTILPFPLKLSKQEKIDLIAFMNSLNDTTTGTRVPAKLPAMDSKYKALNRRKIGGSY